MAAKAKLPADGGLDDRHRATGADKRALDRGVGDPKTAKTDPRVVQAEVYSEFGKMVPAKPKNSIALDERDVSVGRARYQGATHITKNLAIKPNHIAGGGDLLNHANIEIHLYDDKGREKPMTDRYWRDWAYYPADPNKRIATLKKGDALIPVPGATKRFQWETPSTTDAPGQQNIFQDARTYVYLQEFVAGSPETGGYYYQVLTQLDPDATSRNQVKNTVSLTPRDFREIQKIMADPGFEKQYSNRFLIDGLPGTVQSDTGIDSTIPDLVKQRKQKRAK
jgi:hypothetical protein